MEALRSILTEFSLISYSMDVYETDCRAHKWTMALWLAGILRDLKLCELIRSVVARRTYVVTEAKESKLTVENDDFAGWH